MRVSSRRSCSERLPEGCLLCGGECEKPMTRRTRKRLEPTLGDYLAIAVGPILIGLLVGSMVFFLIEVFYQGQFGGRLQFIMAWFVVGAVGIARISIEDGREQAALFAAPLAILVAIAAWRFVEFRGPLAAFSPLLSIGLVALVWWSTDCLTWDCTVIDEDDEDADAGAGLLETAGLDAAGRGGEAAASLDGVTTVELPRKSLWQRFVDARRRPHAPGVWVLYFSLAALPLFGLGQLFLPADDQAARRFAFLLLATYVASALGLLLVSSFLNLRRYLRQRRLTMPATMAAAWVVSGSLVIAGILLVCLILAGRGVGYSVADLPMVASVAEGLATSRWAGGGSGVEEEKGTQLQHRDDAQQLHDGDAEQEAATQDGEPQQPGRDEGSPQNREEPAAARQRPPSSETASRPTATQAQAEQPQQPTADGESAAGEQAARQPSDANDSPPPAAGQQQAADGQTPEATSGQPQSPPSQLPEISSMGGWLKILGWIVLAVVLGGAAWWYRAAILTAIGGMLDALRDLWARLFGGRESRPGGQPQAESPPPQPLRTFAEFSDPFASGTAAKASADELIRYSFEAFEAWSGDLGFRRRRQQTAHEFSEMVGDRLPSISREARQLAELVSWSSFGSDAVPRGRLRSLESLWQRMQAGADPAGSRR